ncbi:MAG: hypothetical protein IIB38_15400 [Candidatus Hydrogenedentes bacterium]|nr:hypothetical protein [Candidatus Hydrogenedentota bacterium]
MQGRDLQYDALAELLKYPSETLSEGIDRCRECLADEAPEVAARINAFRENVADKSLPDIEEIYIRTFDLNPLCTLDTGWQLFGEEYNRGLYMVRIRQEMRRFHIPETSELPDHLTNVLRVLGRMNEEDAADFAVSCVVPAVKKLLKGLKKDKLYRPLIQGILELLEARYAHYFDDTVDTQEALNCLQPLAVEEPTHG